MARRLTLTLLALFAILGGAAAAQAAEPPNQNDPCSRNGRNTCGTNGEGSYRHYHYGIRWFGDYRRVVEGVSGGTFCIDLRFWYPSKSFAYEERSAAGLRNKENEAVSALKLRRMNRALWRYGRSDNAAQQAAVMVYVHRLMGDGAPGEADPRALPSAGRRIYAQVERDAARFAGPYTVRATLPERLSVGEAGELTVEVLTASGRKVPGVEVDLSASGAELAGRVTTGSRGTARTTVKATAAGTLRVEARAASLPAALPTLYVPTRGAAARNAQRVVSAQTARPSVRVQAPVRAQPQITTQISEQVSAPGATITDSVRVSGLGGQPATIQAALYGPYPTREAITCADAPVWTGTLDVPGDGTYVTEPVTLSVPGYYTYRESIAESETIAAVQTPCAEVAETTVVRGSPSITTQVSAQESAPGAQITDSVVVAGLGKLAATVNVELWGPYPSREAMTCEGTPFWTGSFPAAGDGTYTTAPATLTQAGYYTYRESIAATEAYDAVVTPCGEVSETTLARATPKVTTVVSEAVVKPGAELFDRLTVSGLGKTPATVELELFGPYGARSDIDCQGAPYWKGTVQVGGDGEYSSPKATVRRAGFYVFRERIAGSELVAAHEAECQVEAETSLAAPSILGGRGDRVAYVAQGSGGPSRVRLGRLGIDAPVNAIGIDLKSGALGIPDNIRRVGWWRDGAAPGDETGTVLIAGHVDSAKAGAGAFYSLRRARRGDTVTVRAGAKTLRYRVTSTRRMRKAALPSCIYRRTGAPRLVLVTCGGPFDARSGHYRDNIVVTAVPAR
jgi:LPXTG-site transpeptidase (sortase) family protein